MNHADAGDQAGGRSGGGPSVLLFGVEPAVEAALRAAETAFRVTRATPGGSLMPTLSDSGAAVVVIGSDPLAPLAGLRQLREGGPLVDAVPILLADAMPTARCVEAVRMGAADVLIRPWRPERLVDAIERAAQLHTLTHGLGGGGPRLSPEGGVGSGALLVADPADLMAEPATASACPLIGGDYRMQAVFETLELWVAGVVPGLITGEPGTGKTLAARAVHAMAERPGVCVELACGLPDGMLASQLFEADVTRGRKASGGAVREATRGTLVLEGIERATTEELDAMRRLLAAATEPEAPRLVVTSGIPADALAARVAAGTFPSAVFFGLSQHRVALPPLRDRAGDLELLAEHFLSRDARATGIERRLGAEALAVCRAYRWPGNVAELEHAMRRAGAAARRFEIRPDDLPETVRFGPAFTERRSASAGGTVTVAALRGGWTPTPLSEALLEPERQVIRMALEANDWNRSETARQLDIDRTTLYKKIKRFRLDEPGA